jgi:hypothetical protein
VKDTERQRVPHADRQVVRLVVVKHRHQAPLDEFLVPRVVREQLHYLRRAWNMRVERIDREAVRRPPQLEQGLGQRGIEEARGCADVLRRCRTGPHHVVAAEEFFYHVKGIPGSDLCKL